MVLIDYLIILLAIFAIFDYFSLFFVNNCFKMVENIFLLFSDVLIRFLLFVHLFAWFYMLK